MFLRRRKRQQLISSEARRLTRTSLVSSPRTWLFWHELGHYPWQGNLCCRPTNVTGQRQRRRRGTLTNLGAVQLWQVHDSNKVTRWSKTGPSQNGMAPNWRQIRTAGPGASGSTGPATACMRRDANLGRLLVPDAAPDNVSWLGSNYPGIL